VGLLYCPSQLANIELSQDKIHLSKVLLQAAKETKAVTNMVLLSSAGCDLAERHTQPRLREFIDLETMAMQVRVKASPIRIRLTVKTTVPSSQNL
jgi:hypothetical protein